MRYDRVARKVGLRPDRFNHLLGGRRSVPEPEDEFYAKLAAARVCAPDDVREPEGLAA